MAGGLTVGRTSDGVADKPVNVSDGVADKRVNVSDAPHECQESAMSARVAKMVSRARGMCTSRGRSFFLNF
jgi:hypothetical protein